MTNLIYKTTTVANGASLSAAVDSEGKELISVIMPGTLTGTTLTIRTSDSTTGTFNQQYINGDARSYTTAANYEHQLNPPVVASAIKVDTGASEGGARTIKLGFRQFQ